MIKKKLVFKNKLIESKYMNIFLGELKTNSYKLKYLLLLVSKLRSISCSSTVVKSMFSLISSHWNDTRISVTWTYEEQSCKPKWNLCLTAFGLPLHKRRMTQRLLAIQRSIIGKRKRWSQRILLCYGIERCHCYWVLNMVTMCLISIIIFMFPF